LPLLTTFLKSFSRPFLGISPLASTKQQVQEGASADISSLQESRGVAEIGSEADELVEKDIRMRFKRMCEGYYENVSKKLIKEHKVSSHSVC
jgi:regulator of nonsense transcripts 2